MCATSTCICARVDDDFCFSQDRNAVTGNKLAKDLEARNGIMPAATAGLKQLDHRATKIFVPICPGPSRSALLHLQQFLGHVEFRANVEWLHLLVQNYIQRAKPFASIGQNQPLVDDCVREGVVAPRQFKSGFSHCLVVDVVAQTADGQVAGNRDEAAALNAVDLQLRGASAPEVQHVLGQVVEAGRRGCLAYPAWMCPHKVLIFSSRLRPASRGSK